MLTRHRNLALYGLICVFLSFNQLYGQSDSQCPEGTQLTSNGFCIFASWDTPPSPLPGSLSSGGINYSYRRGAGTIFNPAVYQSGGGGGACNAGQGGFTGEITIGGETCSYENGQLIPPPLPVNLVEFEVSVANDLVQIKWVTASEVLNEYFVLERMTYGEEWVEITRVPGRNLESGFQEYSVTDNPNAAATFYYRLLQKDFDGTLTTLGIRGVNISSPDNGEFVIYPNPANLFVNISTSSIGVNEIDIYSSSGQLVKSFSGAQSVIDIRDALPGFYIVTIKDENGVQHVRKLVVQ